MSTIELPEYLTPETMRGVQEFNQQEADLRLQALLNLEPDLTPEPEVGHAPTAPTEPDVPPDMLGARLITTEAQQDSAALEAKRELEMEAIFSRTLNPDIEEARAQAAFDRIRNNDTTIQGDVVGDFMKSNIVLGLDGGYIRDPEDGRIRKGSAIELLINQFGSQVLYEGAEEQKRMAELKAARRQKVDQAVAAGTPEDEAKADLESWYDNQLTMPSNRGIVETRLQEFMRSTLGLNEAAATEFIFDTMPLFYEVNENGDLQNPDDLADNMAYLLDQTRNKVTDAIGLDRETVDNLQRNTIGLGGLIPIPFKPIDRDAPTSLPEAGMRTAAHTGSYLGDVALQNARGRGLQDELLSIPHYREYLGDYQMLSLIPAIAFGLAIPIIPGAQAPKAISMLAKSAKTLAKPTTTVGKFVTQGADATIKGLDVAGKVASPSRWRGAYDAHRELVSLVDEAGGIDMPMPSVFDMVIDRGNPASRVAEVFDRELTTPYKMQAVLRGDEPLTYGHLIGLADSSRSGRHILRRVDEADLHEFELMELDPGSTLGRRALDDEVSLGDRLAMQEAIDEWTVGLEASTVAKAVNRAAKEGESLSEAVVRVVQDTTGMYVPKAFQSVIEVADSTNDAARTIRAFRRAAGTVGSAPVNATNKRMRMVLDLASESSRLGPKEGMKVVSVLQPAFRAVKGLEDAPEGIRYASALSRVTRRTFADIVRGNVPKDMVFVTDRVMMRRTRVTPQLMRQVGEAERAVFATKAVGEGTFQATKGTPEGIMKMVREVVPKHADLDDIERAVAKGEWDTETQSFLSDSVREYQLRRLVPDRMVREPVFETREVGIARQPSIPGTNEARLGFQQEVINPILDTFMAARAGLVETARAAANALPPSRGRKALAGALRRSDARYDERRFTRWFEGDSSTAPASVVSAKRQIANVVGTVASRHRDELVQRARKARAEGFSNPEAVANTEASVARWDALGKQAASKFVETVRRERKMLREAHQAEPTRRVPSMAETVMMVLYRENQARVVNLGVVLEQIRFMEPDRQRQLVTLAIDLVKRDAYRQSWQELMRRFFLADTRIAKMFGLTDSNERLAGLLSAATEKAMYIDGGALKQLDILSKVAREDVDHRDIVAALQQLVDAPIRIPDQAGVQKVVELIRKDAPKTFGKRGAGRRKAKLDFVPVGFEDAIDDAVQAWQLSADTALQTAPIWNNLFRRFPELRFDLIPTAAPQSKYAQQAALMRHQAPVAVVKSVLERLRNELVLAGKLTDEAQESFDAALEFVSRPIRASATGAEVPRAGRMVNEMLDPLMEWSRQTTRNLSGQEMQAMGEAAIGRMTRDGTLYPDYVGGGIIMAGESKANTAMLFQGLSRIMAGTRIPGQSQLTPANRFIAAAIDDLVSVSSAKAVKSKLYTSVIQGMEGAVAPFIYNQARRTMKRWGFDSYATGQSLDSVVTQLKSLPSDDMRLFPVVPGFDSVLRELQDAAMNGSLVNTLENLQARTLKESGSLAGYSAFVLQSVFDAVAYGRQMASYGLLSAGIFALSGIPIPGLPLTRYLGLNLLTAPFMMVGTLGFSGAVRGLKEGIKIGAAEAVPALAQRAADVIPTQFMQRLADKSRALVNTALPRKPDDVLFADLYGRQWTVQEFEELCSTYNVMMTRGDVDQAADMLATLRRDMDAYRQKGKIKTDALPENVRQFLNRSIGGARGVRDMFFNPSLSSFSMQLATYTDGVFRRGVFASAIRDGMRPLQAAQLARAAVLDYGAVPDLVKRSINRYILFASFRMASMREILMAATRTAKGKGDTAWLKVMRTQMNLHEAAGTWTYGSDYDRVRLYTMSGPTFDRQRSGIGGPQDVFSTGAADLVDSSFFVAEMLTGNANDGAGRITQALLDEQIQPVLQAIIAAVTQQRPSRKGRLVPDTAVVHWLNNEDWDWATERYNLKEVGSPLKRDERRPGAPEFAVRNGRGVQYEFTGNGYRTFLIDQFVAVQLMSKRATDDYTKAMISAGYGPDGYDPKYRVNAPFLMFLTGAGTPTRINDPQTQLDRAFRRDAVRR